MIEKCNLSAVDVQRVRNVSRGSEMFCLNSSLNGKAYFRTWFGELELPISLVVQDIPRPAR